MFLGILPFTKLYFHEISVQLGFISGPPEKFVLKLFCLVYNNHTGVNMSNYLEKMHYVAKINDHGLKA